MIPAFQGADGNLEHAVAALVLFGRLGDIVSTYLVTPTLALESNPIVRRLGWKFALSSVVLCFIPYVHVGAGLAIAVASLMVTGSNLSRGWFHRGLGEQKALETMQLAARGIPRRTAMAFTIAGASFVGVTGAVLMYMSGGARYAAYWIGAGILTFAIAIGFHSTLAVARIYRTAK